jgi:lysophospholipase L1-like esterase
MVRLLWITLMFIHVIISACSTGGGARNGSESASEPLWMLALGDSYTIGEQVNRSESWPVQLVRAIRIGGRGAAEPTIIAATGWDTNDLMRAINRFDVKSPFDFVTLQIGVNNQFRGGSISNFEAELSTLISTSIQLAGGDPENVILLSIPDWSVTPFAESAPKQEIADAIDEFNEVIRVLSDSAAVHFIDITEVSRRAKTDLELITTDGLHPSAKMYSEWVELVLPIVNEIDS